VVASAPVVVSVVAVCITVWVALNQRKLQMWIATMQNELQARQLRKDLFDRRFAVYMGMREFLNFIQQRDGENAIHEPEYRQWGVTMEKAEMLFGPEVLAYLREVNEAAGKLYVYHTDEKKIIESGNEKRMEEAKQIRDSIYELLPKRRNDMFRDYLTLGTSK
jgi:hypothetical protein